MSFETTFHFEGLSLDTIRDFLIKVNLIEEQPNNKGHYQLVEDKPVALPVVALPVVALLVANTKGLGKDQKAYVELLKENMATWHTLTPNIKRLIASLEKRGLVVVQDGQFRLYDRLPNAI